MQSDSPASAVPDRFLKRKGGEIPPGAGLEDKRLTFAVAGATGRPSWAVPASQKRRNVAIAFAQSDSSSPRSRVQASRELHAKRRQVGTASALFGRLGRN
jgi:hypothetical protein